MNNVETLNLEYGLVWTAAIFSGFVLLEHPSIGTRNKYLTDLREKWGVGGDSMTAGFLRLSIEAAKHLDQRIENYDCGVFSYEFLEDAKGSLSEVLIDKLTPSEWAALCGNYVVPHTSLNKIIDEWLVSDVFKNHREALVLFTQPLENPNENA